MRNASSGTEAAIIFVGKYQVRIGCELLFASPRVQGYVLLLQMNLINCLRLWCKFLSFSVYDFAASSWTGATLALGLWTSIALRGRSHRLARKCYGNDRRKPRHSRCTSSTCTMHVRR